MCACMCAYMHACAACVCVQAHADPIMLVFVPGVEYGFLCVYNVIWELFEGTHLNIVVIITCFVASVSCYAVPFN